MSKWDRHKDDDGSRAKAPELPKIKVGGESIVVHWRTETWFPDLAADEKIKLKQFHDELINQNKAGNLISVKTMGPADALHFADSILASRAIMKAKALTEIYDFGTGAGFPGIVFAILCPKVKVRLVEIDQKKVDFLNGVIGLIKLGNVDVLMRPMETLPEGSVLNAMSRGAASISKTILLCRKIFPKGGHLFHLKGEEWASEVAAIPTQLCSFWTPGLVSEYRLPVGEIKFAVVKTEKIAD